MIETTRHAVERLCQRFYKNDAVEVAKYKMVGEYMIGELVKECPEVLELKSGKFYVDSYEMYFIVKDSVITTVLPAIGRKVCKKTKGNLKNDRA